MKNNIFYLFILLLFCFNATSQNCNCLISEVETNTVTPCKDTIGTVVVVNSVTSFRNAVNQANSSGGNMTILIENGTYQVASTSSYPYVTASNVVFRSVSGNRDSVILTGGGMTDVNPSTEIGIYAVGNNITIADLTIRNVGNHAIAVTGDSLKVYNVKIQNTYEQMIKGNSSAGGINNGKVSCSLFEYTNGIGPQWYIGGLDIHTGINWIVSDNVFKDIASPSVNLAEHAVHFWDSSANNMVERNRIINCDRGIGFGLGSSVNIGGIIKNNMITNDGTHLFDDVGIGVETSPNTKIYNNTIFIAYQNAIEYRFTATTNVSIANNLTNRPITLRNGAVASLTTNNTNALSSWFTNVAIGDLSLVSSIPSVVNVGTNLSEVTVDINKAPRQQIAGYDIGAFEFYPPLGINQIENIENQTNLFPNPVSYNQQIYIESTSQINKIYIFNSLGKLCETIPNSSSFTSSKLDKGIYLVRIEMENGQIEFQKLIIQ